MTIVNAIFMYFLIWWVMLFTVLPLGVVRNTDDGKGHDAGAPANPMIKKKMIITSIVAAVVLAVIEILVQRGVIQWDAWFRDAIK
jgi:predicted secreted protein